MNAQPAPAIAQAADALARHPEITLAIIYGSVARGQPRLDSDIDVAVKAAMPLTPEQTIRVVEDLAAATGRPIDLVDLARVGEPLLGEILRHGQRIVGSNEALAELRLRHVYLNEDFMPYVRRMLEERNRAWLR